MRFTPKSGKPSGGPGTRRRSRLLVFPLEILSGAWILSARRPRFADVSGLCWNSTSRLRIVECFRFAPEARSIRWSHARRVDIGPSLNSTTARFPGRVREHRLIGGVRWVWEGPPVGLPFAGAVGHPAPGCHDAAPGGDSSSGAHSFLTRRRMLTRRRWALNPFQVDAECVAVDIDVGGAGRGLDGPVRDLSGQGLCSDIVLACADGGLKFWALGLQA